MDSLPRTSDALPHASGLSALDIYYRDSRLLRRNIAFIIILSLGWAAAFTYIIPLMQLRLKSAGVSDSVLGMITGANSWIYSYLVMYFAWRSDHTRSRLGRRLPYLLISAPAIICALVMFPLFSIAWVLVAIYMVKAIFMDIKAATIPLLNIDCVPRNRLARVNALNAMALCVVNFLALRYGMGLADHHPYLPYCVGAALLVCTTSLGILFIKEPPVTPEPRGTFKPWSAMAIAWQDRKAILLMLGVGLMQTAAAMYFAWIWLFADKVLQLDRKGLGEIMAWGTLVPLFLSYLAGALIDRFQGMRMVVFYWLLAVTGCLWVAIKVDSPVTLIIGGILFALMNPFYIAVDVKVYREADPKNVGSITSTNSCLRGIIVGLATLISGFLVEWFGGNYRVAFLFGACTTTLGLICIAAYTLIRQRSSSPSVTPA